jgi:hypothetical protein
MNDLWPNQEEEERILDIGSGSGDVTTSLLSQVDTSLPLSPPSKDVTTFILSQVRTSQLFCSLS